MSRIKSYSAESGYAYQYVFLRTNGQAFIFAATHDREDEFEVRVLVSDACLAQWERPLNATERYAVAKMALFEAFDARSPVEMRRAVVVDAEQANRILRTLDL